MNSNLDQIIQIANSYVRQVAKSGIPITKAFLFGSYAANKSHRGSDIDISIISPKLGQDLIDEMVELGTIAGLVDERIEPHPMSPRDFAEKYSLLAHEIKTNGILLAIPK